jgi:fructosamine-3-kinase
MKKGTVSHKLIREIMEQTQPGFVSTSRTEEVIATLWTIAALLAYGFDLPTWIVTGLFLKAASDHWISIRCAEREYHVARKIAEKGEEARRG